MKPPRKNAPTVGRTASAHGREKQIRPTGQRHGATLESRSRTRGERIRIALANSGGQSFATIRRLERAGLQHDPIALIEVIEQAFRRGYAHALVAAEDVVRDGFIGPEQMAEWRRRVDKWRYAQADGWLQRKLEHWDSPPEPFPVNGRWGVVGSRQNPARVRDLGAVKGGGK